MTRLLVMAMICAALPAVTARCSASSDGFALVWSDEFTKNGRPDPTKWSFETGFVRNDEAQWYQADNAWCEKGRLIIEARRESKPNPTYRAGSTDWRTKRSVAEFTSASLKTEGRHAWTYGRFEMRARIDTRDGLWPAFWTLGAAGEWPSGGEIDIMEYYRSTLLANVAWGTARRWDAKWHTTTKPLTEFGDPNWSKKFHTWRMDWTRGSITLYVDGLLLSTTSLADTINPDGTNPFTKPQYMLVNLAVGGSNGGNPAGTAFPARFEVDYVRVYQQRGDADR